MTRIKLFVCTKLAKRDIRRLGWRWKGWGFDKLKSTAYDDSHVNHWIQFGPLMIHWERVKSELRIHPDAGDKVSEIMETLEYLRSKTP